MPAWYDLEGKPNRALEACHGIEATHALLSHMIGKEMEVFSLTLSRSLSLARALTVYLTLCCSLSLARSLALAPAMPA